MVILGTVGHGKSTFLNRLAGADVFESKKQRSIVTKKPTMYETADFKMIDTPGLNDMLEIDTKNWVDRFNDYLANDGSPQPLALAILLFKASGPPENGDYVVL